jgi:histidinol phosphatase-like PHP family hydrolase
MGALMIDLHTHTLFSDGELLPSELVRRAEVIGYKAIALTDHVDSSNIDFIVPRIVKVCKKLNEYWNIRAIPGVEITHAPLKEIKPLIKYARRNGAKIIVVHGETISEPVIPGTNLSAIEAGCDILAHPGYISKEDVILAKKLGVDLELTTRKSHSATNKHLFKLAKSIGAKLVLNTDSHSPGDLITDKLARYILTQLGLNKEDITKIAVNSMALVIKATH